MRLFNKYQSYQVSIMQTYVSDKTNAKSAKCLHVQIELFWASVMTAACYSANL